MSRNDLNTNIENKAEDFPLTANILVKSGNLANNGINNPIKVTDGKPGTGSVSVQAAGAGSNLFLYITCREFVWGIIIGCPPNEDNYFKYVYYGWPKGENDTYNAADDATKHYANAGSVTFTPSTQSSAPGTQVTIGVTNVSPATGTIQFAHWPPPPVTTQEDQSNARG